MVMGDADPEFFEAVEPVEIPLATTLLPTDSLELKNLAHRV
jgi:hypothetical protein